MDELALNAVVIAGIFGLLVGSFLNVVIHRLPLEASIIRPASHCPTCKTPVKPWDNIPVISYLLLGGRCRNCKVKISLRYPAIEAITGLLFAAVIYQLGVTPLSILTLLFVAALIAAAMIDFDHRIIPDEISVGGALVALLAVPAALHWEGASWSAAFRFSFLGALLGAGLFWSVGFFHARFCAAMGRRFPHWPEEDEDFPKPNHIDYWTWFPGLGFGDVKLMALIGARLGPAGTLETIAAASFAGLLLGLLFGLITRRFNMPFGFGPAIVVGGFYYFSSRLCILFPTNSVSVLLR